MLTRLIHLSLNNRVLIVLVSLALMAVGLYVSTTMPVDVFPDFTAPTVTILTEAHGMAPSEVETLVTFPIETSMNGAAGVRRVRSATAVGFSVVWVEFDWGTNIQVDRQIVAEKLGLVRGSLPPDVEQPIMAPRRPQWAKSCSWPSTATNTRSLICEPLPIRPFDDGSWPSRASPKSRRSAAT